MQRLMLTVVFLAIVEVALAGPVEQGCTYTVSPLTITVPGAGGTGQVTMTTAAGCSWTASSDKSWITVETANGAGSGTVIWRAVPNSLATQRIGFLTVGGRSIFVVQLEPSGPPAPTPTPTIPGAPRQLAASVSGRSLTLSWNAPNAGGAPATYVLAVGSGSGWSNLGSFPTGSTQTSFTAGIVPNGVYFARVSAQNAMGTSPASNEVTFTVPTACASAPAAPSALQSSVSGAVVTLTWAEPSSGAAPSGYAIEAGTGPTLADIAVVNTGSAATTFTASASPGTYFVRVRALTPCGTSPPSTEVALVVRP